uniref:Putative secreted protein n=1 Tax=Anopheles darlingi TaxID=43151 RepID=A0A2M4DJK0_ANODA
MRHAADAAAAAAAAAGYCRCTCWKQRSMVDAIPRRPRSVANSTDCDCYQPARTRDTAGHLLRYHQAHD